MQMSALCQQCKRPEQNAFLCESCVIVLENMLRDLPWLLDELDARIQRLDRVQIGTVGRSRRPDELNVMDFDAAETARRVRKLLQQWVGTVAERHTGRRPPALGTVDTKVFARWLYVHLSAIAQLDCAGRIYRDIQKLVGTDTERKGQLVRAINRSERHFAGPCPTITGHNHHGEPQECGRILYADLDETTVTCPTCQQPIDVERNRLKAAIDRDLLPEPKILETMANLGEKVSRVKFYQWVREQRLRPKGWLHNGELSRFRVRRGDPAVYSLAKARKLRDREAQRQEATQ